MVFAGLYPVTADDFEPLKDAMDKLTLNDASVAVQVSHIYIGCVHVCVVQFGIFMYCVSNIFLFVHSGKTPLLWARVSDVDFWVFYIWRCVIQCIRIGHYINMFILHIPMFQPYPMFLYIISQVFHQRLEQEFGASVICTGIYMGIMLCYGYCLFTKHLVLIL